MKVNIGPYIYRKTSLGLEHWLIEKVFRVEHHWEAENLVNTKRYQFIEWFCDVCQTFLNYTINQYLDRKSRRIEIKIDGYDIWSADHTIATIVHPLLVELKEKKMGVPSVDVEDIPEELKEAAIKEHNKQHGDEAFEDYVWSEIAWNAILDKMIFSMEAIKNSEKFEDDVYTKVKSHQERKKLYMEHDKKVREGTILFGKYFRCLWD